MNNKVPYCNRNETKILNYLEVEKEQEVTQHKLALFNKEYDEYDVEEENYSQ